MAALQDKHQADIRSLVRERDGILSECKRVEKELRHAGQQLAYLEVHSMEISNMNAMVWDEMGKMQREAVASCNARNKLMPWIGLSK